jgi:hypothetical protein
VSIESRLPHNSLKAAKRNAVLAMLDARRYAEALHLTEAALTALAASSSERLLATDETTLSAVRLAIKALAADKSSAEKMQQSAEAIADDAQAEHEARTPQIDIRKVVAS